MLDAATQTITTALTNLRAGVPSQTFSLPGGPPVTVTAADIPALRAQLLRYEGQRYNRIARGLES